MTTLCLMAARKSAALLLFLPNAARDTMLLDLVLPDVLEGEDALGAEDLLDAEPAQLAPVVAGGGEEDVSPVVGDDAAGDELGAGGEVGIELKEGNGQQGQHKGREQEITVAHDLDTTSYDPQVKTELL
nr:unnamed protein product [Digitaria exilis]